MVVFCIVSFCKHCSSRLPILGCVQADFIVYLGHSLEIRETRRACGSCVAGMHSLWSAFNPFRSCCVQAGGLSFSVLPFQEDNLKSSLISLCLITKIPEAGEKGTELPIQPSILRDIFFLVEIKQRLDNKQFSMTLQLNAFLLTVRASHFSTLLFLTATREQTTEFLQEFGGWFLQGLHSRE